ncbi:hypothetical protein PGT21_002805 [Puccinia graminis f. sp. tritici]|uniref:Major facilitator superfamily (MFS) profile domain-containing protein n=1 Tax=Puccinia graminis f. sp. tritici TaxID=56615 RepID=A0A5B0NI24_PUCGR|nr:hypothetical protein PGT21_002805 [Puccinia graminis f. sp. tritici]
MPSSPLNERKPLLSRTPSSAEANEDPEQDPQPLLPEGSHSHPHHHEQRTTRTPLPVRQLIVLCIMRITEPISYTLIFPFINQMLEDLKVSEDPKQIGYYAGAIESLFAIAQLLTAIFWGRLSDRIGRKPVMLTGLLGMAVSVILFGLQKTYLGLIISRFLAGMMNGNVAVLQSIVGEITDATNFADAAAYLPLCYAIGSIVGPIMGGYLSLPAQQYPSLFGGSAFLIEYPYFLPCLGGGLLNFAAIIIGYFYMEETLETKRKRPGVPSSVNDCRADYGTITNNADAMEPTDVMMSPVALTFAKPPSIRSLCTQPLLMVLLSLGIMHFQNTAWQAIVPLYGYTKIENGGLGLGLDDIGFMLSTSGFGMIVVQLWVFPALQRRLGALRVFQLTLILFTISTMLPPLVTYIARLPGNKTSSTVAYMSAVLMLRSPTTMCYVCTLMMTKMLAPNTLALGTLNGMTQTVRAFAQAVAPIVGSSLYAFSISLDILGGNFVWIIMVLICLINHAFSLMMKPQSFEQAKKVRTN